MTVLLLHPQASVEMLGYLPLFLNDDDQRPAVEQLDANYRHGGGWRPMQGWTFDPKTLAIRYPGDPTLKPIAEMRLRKERILVYPHDWVVVVQPDNSFQIARMD
jgi:hypothetical protein